MRKVDRLFEIIQLLRGQRLRTAAFIAGELGVSQRTVYRDIAGLMASGVPIEGERGVGYLISQPIDMPPLHFTPLELRALQMGADLVKAIADPEIVAAAVEASHKIADALPKDKHRQPVAAVANVHIQSDENVRERLGDLRRAIDHRYKIQLRYHNLSDQSTNRLVRPLALEYWGGVWTLTTWCELRDDFRAFRVDRIIELQVCEHHFSHEKGKTYRDFLKQVSET